ncbi:unnamed protein product [Kuraishia capsulata CBS 1993]|uniref:Uncharacterized protein n=1 Tax=Kuraishia capsulata CBS 1993 TaxID=1382522 RepID=W6MSR6_9ASCO|nr:uncharacterized protein KUCA_T00005401001 [Kuraishia capsulata CBS 1993]CDK29413.1 unnamed protein product [Kuraishia capsulata CBS 1993]
MNIPESTYHSNSSMILDSLDAGLIAHICRYLSERDMRSFLQSLSSGVERLFSSPNYSKYLFLSKYAPKELMYDPSDTTVGKMFDQVWTKSMRDNWILGQTITYDTRSYSNYVGACGVLETDEISHMHDCYWFPSMLKVTFQKYGDGPLFLNPNGELLIAVKEDAFSLFLKLGVNGWRVHHENGDNNNEFLIFPTIPLVPRPLVQDVNFFPIESPNDSAMMIIFLKHSVPGERFVDVCTRKGYFIALDSRGEMWVNAYDSLLAPLVRLRYDFAISSCMPLKTDTQISKVTSIAMGSTFIYCVAVENKGFLFFRNGLKLHHETFIPNLSSSDMRPLFISFQSLVLNSEKDIVDWKFEESTLFYIDRQSFLFIVPITLGVTYSSMVYQSEEPNIIPIRDVSTFKKLRCHRDFVVIEYDDRLCIIDHDEGTWSAGIEIPLSLGTQIKDITIGTCSTCHNHSFSYLVFLILENGLLIKIHVVKREHVEYTILCRLAERGTEWRPFQPGNLPSNANYLSNIVTLTENGIVQQVKY